MVNSCWFFFKLGIAVVMVVALVVGTYLYTHLDEEIRGQVEQMLAKTFPRLNVSVGGARLVQGRGIAVYDLTLSETALGGRQNNLLVVDEVMVVCDMQWTNLVQDNYKIDRIVAKHPQLWISRETGGGWNLESLWPLPKQGKCQPVITIQNALIAISDQRHPGIRPLMLRDINLTIVPDHLQTTLRQPVPGPTASNSSPTSMVAVAAGAHSEDPQETGTDPSNKAGVFAIDGTFSSLLLTRAKIHARIDLVHQRFNLTGNLEQLKLSEGTDPWLRLLGDTLDGTNSTIGNPSRNLSHLPIGETTLHGLVSARFEVALNWTGSEGPRFAVSGRLTRGQLSHPRLPRPLSKLSCNWRCDQDSFNLETLHANCGPAVLAGRVDRQGWQAAAPFCFSMNIHQLPLDVSLRNCLPPTLLDQWKKYQPTGQVDLQAEVIFDGSDWFPRATLTGRNLAFESDKFNYRLTGGSGTLKYTPRQNAEPATLEIDLEGVGGGRRIDIVGRVLDPSPGAAGYIELTGHGLNVEQRMIAALPEKPRNVIASMHPEGKFDFRWRAIRTHPGQNKPRTSLRLELVDFRFLYDKFPYPLRGVHGFITAQDRHWRFHDLVSGGTRIVHCQGSLDPTETGSELNLQFTGDKIPLDEDLRQAVPESVRKAWTEIRPHGEVDLTANVRYRSQPGQSKKASPEIRVTIRPRRETASIHPTFFPYLMENLEGTISYHDGRLTLSNMRAGHRQTTLQTQGAGSFSLQQGWQFRLEGLSVDRLRLASSRDFVMALPPKLRKLIEQMQPTGTFSVSNGVLGFAKGPSPMAPVRSNWDFQLACHQASLQIGIDLKNIFGSARLQGSDDGRQLACAGDLALDSINCLDVQFTDIRGPLWIDPSRLLLGRGACDIQQRTPCRLTAKAYGGQAAVDVAVNINGLPKFSVEGSLTTADLARLGNERLGGDQELTGTLSAILRLQGEGHSEHTLEGNGQIQIRDAKIYELPLLVGLLKVLRSRSPDTTAFNQSDMKFRLQGRHIYFDKIDFLGDAVSLYGTGTTNFDQQLNMVFHGMVGRNDFQIPFIKKFVTRTNQNIMQMYVGGTLANPQIHTQAFPGINQLLQQIQNDLETPMPQKNQAHRGSGATEYR